MARRTIRLDPLDIVSVQQALAELTQFRGNFMTSCDKVLNTLAERGAEYARNELAAGNAVYTGHLQSSTGFEPVDGGTRVSKVVSTADYAAYVEYGTGIWGEAFPHPAPEEVGWEYDIHGHGNDGWTYFNPNDHKRHHSIGYMSRPYMYNTKLYLEEIAPQVTASVFLEM